MFDRFGPLFGIRFSEVTSADAWAPGVKLYRVINAADDRTLAYIYFDMFPRDGKYGHMMMVPLIAGRAAGSGLHGPGHCHRRQLTGTLRGGSLAPDPR